jgi:hypothetical protein
MGVETVTSSGLDVDSIQILAYFAWATVTSAGRMTRSLRR